MVLGAIPHKGFIIGSVARLDFAKGCLHARKWISLNEQGASCRNTPK